MTPGRPVARRSACSSSVGARMASRPRTRGSSSRSSSGGGGQPRLPTGGCRTTRPSLHGSPTSASADPLRPGPVAHRPVVAGPGRERGALSSDADQFVLSQPWHPFGSLDFADAHRGVCSNLKNRSMAALLPAAPARPESRGPGLIGGPRRSGLRDREIADFEVQVRASDAPIVVKQRGSAWPSGHLRRERRAMPCISGRVRCRA